MVDVTKCPYYISEGKFDLDWQAGNKCENTCKLGLNGHLRTCDGPFNCFYVQAETLRKENASLRAENKQLWEKVLKYESL